jgi:hypothetical protein
MIYQRCIRCLGQTPVYITRGALGAKDKLQDTPLDKHQRYIQVPTCITCMTNFRIYQRCVQVHRTNSRIYQRCVQVHGTNSRIYQRCVQVHRTNSRIYQRCVQVAITLDKYQRCIRYL